jgi:hypothetical protein
MQLRPWIVTLLTITTAAPAAAETARGVVYDDRNGDGRRQAGEPGLPGVRVSNGREVVLTDAEGRYALDVGAEATVFITKPAGWATPVNGQMLPRFYYIHQPQGSPPGLRYPGIDPTGPLPASIDFPLRRRPEERRFEALLFSDTQPQSQAELDFIRDGVIAELIGTRARFGMTLGDILFDDLSLFPRYVSLVAQLGIPWYNVPGNHEINFESPDDRHSLDTFRRWFGPPYYAFEYGDAVFFVLDNIFYQGGGRADPADFRGDGGYVARFDEDQLAWLKAELAHVPQDKLVFLAMHSPLQNDLDPESARANTQNRRELFALLSGRRHLYAVAGHTHTTEHHYFEAEDGFAGPEPFHHHVLATVSGSWWSGPLDDRGIPSAVQRDGTPNGYHVLEVDGVDLAVRYKASGRPVDEQMRIVFDVAHHGHEGGIYRDFRHGELLDGRFSVDEVPAAEVLVNLYDGGPRSRVEFSVGGRGPFPMERRRRPDPFVAELFQRHAGVTKPWVQAVPSSHVFVADLPDDLGPGTYTVTVRAVDEFGRKHHAHRILEIAGSSAVNPDPVPGRPGPGGP